MISLTRKVNINLLGYLVTVAISVAVGFLAGKVSAFVFVAAIAAALVYYRRVVRRR